jgi:hypothetical protein
MPDPIQASHDLAQCTLDSEPTLAENEAQMCLSSAHPSSLGSAANSPAASAPSAPSAPSSAAVSTLVSRFTPPTVLHPPVEPSLARAVLDCGVEGINLALTSALVVVAVPETAGASLLAGARIGLAGASLLRCIERDEARQIADGNHADQAADCRAAGALPVTTADGSVACVKRALDP